MKKRRAVWLLLWLLSIIGISFYGGTVSYALFWALTLIFVMSVIYLVLIFFRFKIYQELGSRTVVCDQPVSYYFVLQNEDKFTYAGVSVKMFSDFSNVVNMPGETEYELLPGDKVPYETTMICKYRGEYEVGISQVTVTDFLRLFKMTYRFPGAMKAIVYPKVVQLDTLKTLEENRLWEPRESLYGDAAPDLTVRDYVTGDSLKQIHFKASAREQKLKTRLRIGEEKQGMGLVLDIRRFSQEPGEYLPLENKMLEVLLALGYYLAGHNLPFVYTQCGENGESVHVAGLHQFDLLYEEACRVIFDKDVVPSEGIAARLSDCREVFFILHEMNDVYYELAQELGRRGTGSVFYFVDAPQSEIYVGNYSRQIHLSSQAELEEVL